MAEEAGDRVLPPGPLGSFQGSIQPTEAPQTARGPMTARSPRGWRGSLWSHRSARSGVGVHPVLLVLPEVELGDHDGLFRRVGEADRPVCLQGCAEEPAGAGGRFKAGGGTTV